MAITYEKLKKQRKWMLCDRGAYFGGDESVIREIYKICGEIIAEIEAEKAAEKPEPDKQ